MNGMYFFDGYEIEFPINFKEKKFVNEEKINVFDVWFSDRQPTTYNTWFAGVHLPQGIQLKFKYYLTSWFNKDYTATNTTTGQLEKPYANFTVNLFYISASYQIFRGTKVSNK